MMKLRPITKLLVHGDPAKADEMTIDCTEDEAVGLWSKEAVAHMRCVARQVSPPDRPVQITTFMTTG